MLLSAIGGSLVEAIASFTDRDAILKIYIGFLVQNCTRIQIFIIYSQPDFTSILQELLSFVNSSNQYLVENELEAL